MKPAACRSVQFGLPQAVEIAVGIDGQRLVAGQGEHDAGILARGEELALTAVFGDQLHPFNIMRILHRMIHTADVYGDGAAVNGHGRDVLFAAGFHRVGDELIHLHAAAGRDDAGVADGFDDEAAFGAAYRTDKPKLLKYLIQKLNFKI